MQGAIVVTPPTPTESGTFEQFDIGVIARAIPEVALLHPRCVLIVVAVLSAARRPPACGSERPGHLVDTGSCDVALGEALMVRGWIATGFCCAVGSTLPGDPPAHALSSTSGASNAASATVRKRNTEKEPFLEGAKRRALRK